jgi:HD-GYP domain-containing protein (c-di-GMP phosphodiesterase class II)
MRMHPAIGEAIVKPLRSGASLLPIIRHHHENFDGTGYPDGLAGRAIPHLARIVAVCDAYDALVTDRPYRKAKSPDQAISVLVDGAGKQWDAEAVDVLVSEMSNITALGIA